MAINSVDIKLRNANNQEVTYTDVETVTFPGTSSGTVETFTAGQPLSSVPIVLDFSGGDQVVDVPSGYVARSAVIPKPSGIEQVLAKGVSAAGLVGEYVTPGSTLSVNLDFSGGNQTITPVNPDTRWNEVEIPKPSNFENIIAKGQQIAGLSGQYVTPGTSKSVTLDFSGGDMSIAAVGDERWAQIDVFKPATLLPENIAENVNIAGISGTFRNQIWDIVEDTVTTLSSNLTVVRSLAFAGLHSLQTVSFPSCTLIGSSAFYSCDYLEDVYAPLCSLIESNAFTGCSRLLTASFPACTEIRSSAFANCSRIQTWNMPLLHTVGAYGLRNCTLSSNTSLPNLQETGNYPFYSARIYNAKAVLPALFPASKSIFYSANVYDTTFYLSEITGRSISSPFNSAFLYNCSFPDMTTSGVFYSTKLYSCTLPTFTDAISLFYGASLYNTDVTLIRSQAVSSFFYNTSLNNLTFTFSTDTTVPLFSSTTLSKVVIIPTGAANGGAVFTGGKFYDCVFKSIPLLTSSIFVTKTAISGSVGFPDTVQIYSSALLNASYISSAYFPLCRTIAQSAFYGCSYLRSLYLLSTTYISLPNASVFTNTPMSNQFIIGRFGSIYVRQSMLASYKTRAYWSLYSDRLVGLTDEEIAELEELYGG